MSKALNITFYIVLSLAMLLAIAVCVFSYVYPQKYGELVHFYAVQNNLNPALVSSVINVESHHNPNAESSAGALGLMQLLPATANWLAGRELTEEELKEPNLNLSLGCQYLAQLLTQFPNLECALAAYNAGPGNVSRWLADPEISPDGTTLQAVPFSETTKYVEKVKNNLKVYQFLMK